MATTLAALACCAVVAVGAQASATPVGPLPKGPVTAIATSPGHSFTVRLPKAKVAGRVWRIARAFDSSVVRETREGETTTVVWVTFKAVGSGKTRIVFALTRGETSHAFAARTFAIAVR